MQPKRFVIAFVASLLLLAAMVFLVIDHFAGAERPGPDYRRLLLEESTGPRVIIDSGSNGKMGISTLLLEEWAQRPVINLADMAQRSLRHKVLRLEAVARSGDLVLLPLEWSFYVGDGRLQESYAVDLLTTDEGGYYPHLGLRERLGAILHSLPPAAAQEVAQFHWQRRGHVRRIDGEELLGDFHQTFTAGRGGSSARPGPEPDDDGAGERSCDDYILRAAIDARWQVGSEFLAALERLARLQRERGVHVVFAWPSAVGDSCYASAAGPALDAFAADLRARIAAAGLHVAGQPRDYRFPSTYYLNTWYHLNAAGQQLRTQRLVRDLAALSLPLAANPDGLARLGDAVRTRLHRLAEADAGARALLPYMALPQPWDGAPLAGLATARHALLPQGWRGTAAGLRTAGAYTLLQATLAPTAPRPAFLCIRGRYQAGQGALVYVNGTHLGRLGPAGNRVALPPQANDLAFALVNVLRSSETASGRKRARPVFVLHELSLVDDAAACDLPSLPVVEQVPGQGEERKGRKAGKGGKKKKKGG